MPGVTEDLLLPEGARLLHIGPQKTGTTAIQVAMAEAREAMAEHGAYYPAGDHRRRKAGWALGLPGGPRDTPMRHWDELVAEVRAAGHLRVCVSDENFARAEPAVAERIVRELGGDDAHVVAVARRLDRYLPSQWQERVKAGLPHSFDDWLRDVFDEDSTSWERRNVWLGHDVEALVQRWVALVGPDRFTLVVADESDRGQLIDVFQRLLGLPAGTLQSHPDRSNQGFGLSELELVRGLRNAYLRNGWDNAEYRSLVRRGVQRSLRARGDRAPGPRHAPLPDWALTRVREASDRRAEALPGLGVRIVGDPAWLRVPSDEYAEPVDADHLALPVDLVVDLFEALITRQHQAVPVEPRAAAAPSEPSGRELLRLLGGRVVSRFRGRDR